MLCVTIDGGFYMKKILSLLLILCVILSCSVISVNAETVEKDYSILKLLNIMVGDANGDMRWNDNVTRAEFTKVAMTISNFRKSIPASQKTSPFADVPYKHWASSYIRAGVDNGIVQGYPDSTFKPDNNVLYEEALTILLKVLGYSNSDFGSSYPYGQYSLANNIDLTDEISVNLGDTLTRKDVADLLINALETNFKGSTVSPYSNFDVAKLEDVILLATYKEDESIPVDRIKTSMGTYKFDIDLSSNINRKGTIILKDGDTIIYFNPENGDEINEYAVYSVLSDGVVTYKNGDFSQFTIADNTVTYINNNPTTFVAVKSTLEMGDLISVVRTNSGEIDYISIVKGDFEGPFIYASEMLLSSKIGDVNDYLMMKNGNIITVDELDKNDVYYFYQNLKILMAYDTKVTGVYSSATPNQDAPAMVEVSGKVYEIESTDAFRDLSSSGIFKYGDTVTLLLGKDKKIAGVVTSDEVVGKNVGYLIDAGTKLYETDNDKEVTDYYITILTPDGETETYKAKRDFESYKNSIVEVEFEGEKAVITRLRDSNVKASGVFNAESFTFGKYVVSKNVKILDVSTTNSNDTALYVTVEPQRIDGVNLSFDSVLYCETNEKNAITKLILKGVTNDYYSYGYVTKVDKNSEMMMGTYKYTFDGSIKTYTSQGSIFGVNAGPAKILIGAMGIESMQNISKINGVVSEINNTYVTVGNNHYLLADDVKIFYRNYDWDYMLLTVEDISDEDSDYQISGVYHDKSTKSGGRVRIIVVNKKPSK